MEGVFNYNDYEWKVKEPTGKNRRELKNMVSRMSMEEGKGHIVELKAGDLEVYNFCNRIEYLKFKGENIELSEKTYDETTDVKMIDEVINSISKFDTDLDKHIKK